MATHSLHKDILAITKANNWFRKEVVTGEHSQVVLMSIESGEEIGEEAHSVDQTLVFVEGTGEAILADMVEKFDEGDLFFIPAGTKHNFRNTGLVPLKLFTVYAPSEHVAGMNHRTKADAKHDPNEQHG